MNLKYLLLAGVLITGPALAQSMPGTPGAPDPKPAAPAPQVEGPKVAPSAPLPKDLPKAEPVKSPKIVDQDQAPEIQTEPGWLTKTWNINVEYGNWANIKGDAIDSLADTDPVSIKRAPVVNPISDAGNYKQSDVRPAFTQSPITVFRHEGYFVARADGRYAFRATVSSSAGPANRSYVDTNTSCLVELVINDQRLFGRYFDYVSRATAVEPQTGGIDLTAGLYKIVWTNWCGHGQNRKVSFSATKHQLDVRLPGSEDWVTVGPSLFVREKKK